jgi:hypothetical protein
MSSNPASTRKRPIATEESQPPGVPWMKSTGSPAPTRATSTGPSAVSTVESFAWARPSAAAETPGAIALLSALLRCT